MKTETTRKETSLRSRPGWLCVLLLALSLLTGPRLPGASNGLRITSISHEEGCTTLTWASHPGEHYRVYWTDAMNDRPFWRVAAFCVPADGTNTTWSEGCESMMMMGQGGSGQEAITQAKLSEEELAAHRAKLQATAEAGLKYLEAKLAEATAAFANVRQQKQSGEAMQSLALPPFEEGTNSLSSSNSAVAKFYRVARLPHGFADGWGVGLGNVPAGLTNMVAVAAGGRDGFNATPFTHSLALRCDGTVAAWGANYFGQTNVPTNLVAVVAVAAGGRHSLALKEDGTITVWGDNSLGQVTNAPANLTNVVDVKAGLWHSLALKADGTVAVWGDLFNVSNAVPVGLSNVIAIAAGPRHCLALRSDRTVVGWGFSYSFLENFLPTNSPAWLTNVVALSAGMEHNEALRPDGSVLVWGSTNNLGNGVVAGITNATAVAACWHLGQALLADGSVQTWGQGANDIGSGLNDTVALTAGALHSLVIRTNQDGLRIVRQPMDVNLPIGTNATLSVIATNLFALPMLYQWEKNGTNLSTATNATLYFPALTDSDDGVYRVRVSSGLTTMWSRHVSVTNIHLPVITNQIPELDLRRTQDTHVELQVSIMSKGSRSVFYTWYKNGVPLPLLVYENKIRFFFRSLTDEGEYWVVVRNPAGSTTSQVWQVSVTLHGEAMAWGDNTYGQGEMSRAETNFITLAAGGYHSLGLRENGTVAAWGWNYDGQTNVPPDVTNAITIAAGGAHSLALRENGTVTAWGWNGYSQTNVPASATNVALITAGNTHNLALRRDGTVIGWGDTSFGALSIPTNLINVVGLEAGDSLSYALLSNGTVRAWGSGGFGAVTIPTNLSDVVKIAAGHTHLLALKSDGTVVGLGLDSGWGETQPPAGLSNVLQVSAGFMFSAALLNDGTVRAWGRSDADQTNVLNGLSDVKQIAAGGFHCLALAYSRFLNYPVRPSDDLLIIYNTNSANSVALKDYYLANRPMIGDALTLGLGCQTGELFDSPNQMTNQLITPVLQWLTNHPTSRPNFYLFMLDIPSTYLVNNDPDTHGSSVQWHLRENLPSRKPFVSQLNMATFTDATNYVNKLVAFGNAYSPGKVVISPHRSGYANTTFPYDADCDGVHMSQVLPVMQQFTGSSNQVQCRQSSGIPIANATNLAGYWTPGLHAGLSGGWATNGVVKFFGDSSWFLMTSGESFNGVWNSPTGQGSFQRWFERGSFGGTNYENTPVVAGAHVWEPHFNVMPFRYAFALWEVGKYFPVAFWNMSGFGVVSPNRYQATGDPFVTK